MKRFTILITLLTLLALPLAGCADPAETPGAADGAGTGTGSEVRSIDYDAMDEEEAKVRRVADAAVKKEYGITDFTDYGISTDFNEYFGNYFVIYSLKIQGYASSEEVAVQVSPDYEVKNVNGFDIGRYSPYLEVATEEAVRQAEGKLDEQVKGYSENSGYYLGIDNEGNLLLCCEVITHQPPPAPAVDGDPNDAVTVYIDHDHLFFSEIICPKP